MEQDVWDKLSPEQKKIQLYLEQKKTLEVFFGAWCHLKSSV